MIEVFVRIHKIPHSPASGSVESILNLINPSDIGIDKNGRFIGGFDYSEVGGTVVSDYGKN
jgi:hypothetical protein